MKLAIFTITIALAAIATAVPIFPAQNDMPHIPVRSSKVEAVQEQDDVRGLLSFQLLVAISSAFH